MKTTRKILESVVYNIDNIDQALKDLATLENKKIEKPEDELCDLQKKLDSAENYLRGCKC